MTPLQFMRFLVISLFSHTVVCGDEKWSALPECGAWTSSWREASAGAMLVACSSVHLEWTVSTNTTTTTAVNAPEGSSQTSSDSLTSTSTSNYTATAHSPSPFPTLPGSTGTDGALTSYSTKVVTFSGTNETSTTAILVTESSLMTSSSPTTSFSASPPVSTSASASASSNAGSGSSLDGIKIHLRSDFWYFLECILALDLYFFFMDI
ncbi:hypothetical protein LTR99_002267 [Exophiala xenobiotica]|uniref:Uncharacterized protein n=1 Tax=Vermiconidia calcicola TaxID=1690605 RepID=A0AAV9QFG4_9PEZI|nr:hypothetical protein LTR92_004683 [Exophiala xenobiotica]KAK5542396.1 hypothetical protein LTR25_002281 [Vermiconidia calcicola]KAK5546254.1 hypothetical protein LTR23_003705 [Chaetothyriales sp. CCFEE 6169]KAK5225954.1 hypothetical protein LTR72_003857 [Exophiala xenobiotica]KAK5272871.1 hypothetical protein LTR96_002503 [Exophiala xenobiotica]